MSKIFTGLAQTFRDSGLKWRLKAKEAVPGSYEEGFWEGIVAGLEAAATEAATLAVAAQQQEIEAGKVIPLRPMKVD
jgi:predicted NAD/FAD-binding protein